MPMSALFREGPNLDPTACLYSSFHIFSVGDCWGDTYYPVSCSEGNTICVFHSVRWSREQTFLLPSLGTDKHLTPHKNNQNQHAYKLQPQLDVHLPCLQLGCSGLKFCVGALVRHCKPVLHQLSLLLWSYNFIYIFYIVYIQLLIVLFNYLNKYIVFLGARLERL